MNHPPLHALTIHEPWSWAISTGAKWIENRGWPPPAFLFDHYLAIHAGKGLEADSYAKIAADHRQLGLRDAPPPIDELPLSAVVAVARVQGAVRVEAAPERFDRLRALETRGQVPDQRLKEALRSPWAFGEWLWVLQDITAIEPIPARGYQRLWTVPPAVADQVREAWRKARSKP